MKLVYVLSKNGKPLMPTKRCNRVAYLLKNGLAKVVKLSPFTIQLLYDTTEYIQEVVVGLDTGANRVGCSAVTKDGKVLYQSETILRDNIRDLMTQRREYRRTRRNRKTRYRKPRFLNRKRPKGWLPPSLKSKSDSTVKIVAKLSEILPFKTVRIEIAKFDIQKLKNPNISGVQYQQGALYQYHNIRHYVFTRDGYTCQICKKKGGILITHHIIPRSQGGSDMPDNLITLHDTCHKDFHAGKIKKTFRKPKTYREATIVTILKNNIIKQLKELGFKVEVTFGNITKVNRIQLGLPKNHYNDAIAIALNTGNIKVQQPDTYFVNKCFPRGNYRLFKGAHSHIRNQTERYLFGYQRNDIVKVNKKGEKGIGYIKGRMSSGYFVIYDFLGNKLFSSVHHRYLKLVERFKTLSTMEVKNATSPSPP